MSSRIQKIRPPSGLHERCFHMVQQLVKSPFCRLLLTSALFRISMTDMSKSPWMKIKINSFQMGRFETKTLFPRNCSAHRFKKDITNCNAGSLTLNSSLTFIQLLNRFVVKQQSPVIKALETEKAQIFPNRYLCWHQTNPNVDPPQMSSAEAARSVSEMLRRAGTSLRSCCWFKEIPANQLRLENWFADCLQGLLYIHLHWWLARFLNHQQYLMFICNFDGKSAVKPAEMIGIYWNCPPPPSNSPHQDYYICVGNPYKTFTCHCY